MKNADSLMRYSPVGELIETEAPPMDTTKKEGEPRCPDTIFFRDHALNIDATALMLWSMKDMADQAQINAAFQSLYLLCKNIHRIIVLIYEKYSEYNAKIDRNSLYNIIEATIGGFNETIVTTDKIFFAYKVFLNPSNRPILIRIINELLLDVELSTLMNGVKQEILETVASQ